MQRLVGGGGWARLGCAGMFAIGIVALAAGGAAGGGVAATSALSSSGQAAPFAAPGGRAPGYYVVPSLSVSGVYDDNVFAAPSNPAAAPQSPGPSPTPAARTRQDDVITRISPGLQGGYVSAPFTLLGSYTLNSDHYADHSDLDNTPSGQLGSLRGDYSTGGVWKVGVSGGFRQTQTPREINSLLIQPLPGGASAPPVSGSTVGTGLDVGRARSEHYSLSTDGSYATSPLTTLSAHYGYSRANQVGAASTEAHTAGPVLEHQASPLDRVEVGYEFRYFDRPSTSGQPPPSTTPTPTSLPQFRSFHVLTAGWTRQLTELTSAKISGGPRLSDDGKVDGEAAAEIVRQFQDGHVVVDYRRSQFIAAGAVGAIDSDRATATLNYQILQEASVDLGFGFAHNRGEGFKTDAYSTQFAVNWVLTSWLSLSLSHQFTFQTRAVQVQGGILTSTADRDVYHNIVTVSLSAGYPLRLL